MSKDSEQMSLEEVFGAHSQATFIFRGDSNVKGYLGTPFFQKGKRFEVTTENGGYTFIADQVKIKPLDKITPDEFNRHVNGTMVMPLIPSDEGKELKPEETCTVVEFKTETGELMPACWLNQDPLRLV